MGQNFINGFVNVGSEAHRPENSLANSQGVRFSPDSVVLKKERGREKFNETAPSSGISSILALAISRIANQLILAQNNLLWRQDVDNPNPFDPLYDQKQFESDTDEQLSRGMSADSLTAVRFLNSWIIADGSGRPIQLFTNKRGMELGLETPNAGVAISTAGTGLGGDGGQAGDKPKIEQAFPVFGMLTDDQLDTTNPAQPFYKPVELTSTLNFPVQAIQDVDSVTKVANLQSAATLIANIVVNQGGATSGNPRFTGGHNLAALFVRMDPTDTRSVLTDGPFVLNFTWDGQAPVDASQDFYKQEGWNINVHYTTRGKWTNALEIVPADPWTPTDWWLLGSGPNGLSTVGGQFSYGTAYWFPQPINNQDPSASHPWGATTEGPSDPILYWQWLASMPLAFQPQITMKIPLPLDDAITIGDLAFLIQIGCSKTSGGTGRVRIYNLELTNSGIPSDNQGDDASPPVLIDGVHRFTTANAGLRYGYTELREFRLVPPGGTAGETQPIEVLLESNLSPITPQESIAAFSFASQIGVKVVRPPLTNAKANKWRLYRSTDAALNEETKDFTKWARIGYDMPASQDTYFDAFDRDGFPMNLITPEFLPPFLSIGGAQIPANDPPPLADVVGSFAGHTVYADKQEEGVWRWSRRGNPHAVPDKYQTLIDGTVTAFADLGSLLVFTDEQVVAYPSLAVAADSTFLPGRNARVVSPGRGNLARRGVVVFSMPGREPMAVFTAVDGLWITNATQAAPFSRMLDWPMTLDETQLASAELVHDIGERRLLLTYLKDNARWALSFYYDRPQGVRVLGPSRVPKDGMAHTTSDGQSLLFSASNGIVYQEKVGIEDWALLEPGSGGDRRIVVKLKSQRIYPWGRRHHGQMKEFGLYVNTPAPGKKVSMTIRGRRDGEPETPITVDFSLDFPGWTWSTVDLAMESFTAELESSLPDFPELVEWDWVLDPTGAPRGEGK